MVPDLHPAMAFVEGLRAGQFLGGGGVEVAFDLGVQGGLVVLDRQKVVGPCIDDGLGESRVAAHGVDGDQGAVQVQPLQEGRNGGDLVGFHVHRLLPQHQLGVGGEGRHQMQRRTAGLAIMAAARGFAVNGDRSACWGQHWATQAQKQAENRSRSTRFKVACAASRRRERHGGSRRSAAGSAGALRPNRRCHHNRRCWRSSRRPPETEPPAADRPLARAGERPNGREMLQQQTQSRLGQ